MSIVFRKEMISAEAFESANAWDVDGDDVLDIVSGEFWYKGPEFVKRFRIGDVPRVGEYYDDFSTIPMDIAGNGRLDFITGGWWGENLRWRECPEDPTEEWPEHILAAGIGNIETTRAWDIDGDGELEIVPNTPGAPQRVFKLDRATGAFTTHILSEEPLGHGFGFGDVDNDGVNEIVFSKGILKPTGHPLRDKWVVSEAFDIERWDGSCPMLVADINGDGKAEIIVGSAHSYGLDWYERLAPGEWKRHPIDPFCAQYHDLHWVDIDGDGQCELVTGKRHRAHNSNEAGEEDPLGVYTFKWTGEGFSKQVIDYVLPGGCGGGVGIHFALVDLRGSGRLDIVAPGKDGLFVYWNLGSPGR